MFQILENFKATKRICDMSEIADGHVCMSDVPDHTEHSYFVLICGVQTALRQNPHIPGPRRVMQIFVL